MARPGHSASGVPEFSAQDVNGRVSYSINAIPAGIPARLTRTGFEIAWEPLFAFTMYADRDRDSAMSVNKVDLQHRAKFTTDDEARAFVEATLAQFAKGKWKRYADPEWDVLLTGRSSILDEAGAIEPGANTIDPNYKFSREDWAQIVRVGPRWRWIGDGVLATLSVNNSPGSDGKPAYRMHLEFELLAVKRKRDADNLAAELQKGDAKGWNSTAEHQANKKQRAAQLKQLAANAVKRGDAVAQPIE